MTFLTPIALAGLAAVSAPVLIHLLNKFRVKVVRWGATRFLQECLQKNQRRLQIEDLALLILRCLVIALLALSFARPVINPQGEAAGAMDAPAVAVLLMDQSASMGQSDGLHTRFDTAKEQARKELDAMAAGSQAALFMVTDRVNQVIARPTNNLVQLKHFIDLSEPGCRTSDLAGGIRTAFDTLRPFQGARKEILIFTDNQALAWKQIEDVKPLLGNETDVRVRVIQAGQKAEDNLAVTSLRTENMTPVAGQLCGCLVEVSNWGGARASGVRVTLSLGDGAPSDETVIDSIEPGKSRVVRLNVRFGEAGCQLLRAAIPPDRLPADDQRTLAVRVINRIQAAVVEGSRAKTNADRDSFFLVNALAPVPPAMRESYHLKTEAMPASRLDEATMDRYNIVLLCNAGKLHESASRNLAKYVKEGGSLVIFPGPDVAPADYNDNAILKPLMPAELGPLTDPGKGGGFLAWEKTGYMHPVTALWNGQQNRGLGSVRATSFFPLKPREEPGADKPAVVVRYTDGTPAIVERAYGKGRVVLFSSSATTKWNNLPIHPDFIPLLERLCGYLMRSDRQGAASLAPGAVFQGTVAAELAGREFSVVRPDAKGQRRPVGKIESTRGEALIRYSNTETAGGYQLFASGVERPVAVFAVQMNPAESNLGLVAPERLAALDGGGKTPTAAAAPGARAATRRDFTALLFWLAVAAAVGEMALAHKFSLAK